MIQLPEKWVAWLLFWGSLKGNTLNESRLLYGLNNGTVLVGYRLQLKYDP